MGSYLDSIEPAMFGIGQGEIRAQKLGAGAKIDDTAIGIHAAADPGVPAIAEVDPTGERRFGDWRSCRSRRGNGRGHWRRRRNGRGRLLRE